jgi:hypothetical protein
MGHGLGISSWSTEAIWDWRLRGAGANLTNHSSQLDGCEEQIMRSL